MGRGRGQAEPAFKPSFEAVSALPRLFLLTTLVSFFFSPRRLRQSSCAWTLIGCGPLFELEIRNNLPRTIVGDLLDQAMDLGPTFRKFRAVSFTCIAVVALVWTAASCVVLYMHWGNGDGTQSSLIVVLLCVNVITVILLPALILVEFRIWLDAARMTFLLIAHFSAAIGFTLWATKYQCPTTDDGVCSLMNIYVLLASWVNPALVLTYTTCLAIVAHRHHISSTHSEPATEKYDIEAIPKTPTTAGLPIMEVPRSQRNSLSLTAHKHLSARMSRQPAWLAAPPPLPTTSLPRAQPDVESPSTETDVSSTKRKSARSSARLSKPLPSKYF